MKTANNMIEQIRQANANREERRPSFADTHASSPVISQPQNQQAPPIPYYPPPSYPPPDDGQSQKKPDQANIQYVPSGGGGGAYHEEQTARIEYIEPSVTHVSQWSMVLLYINLSIMTNTATIVFNDIYYVYINNV